MRLERLKRGMKHGTIDIAGSRKEAEEPRATRWYPLAYRAKLPALMIAANELTQPLIQSSLSSPISLITCKCTICQSTLANTKGRYTLLIFGTLTRNSRFKHLIP